MSCAFALLGLALPQLTVGQIAFDGKQYQRPHHPHHSPYLPVRPGLRGHHVLPQHTVVHETSSTANSTDPPSLKVRVMGGIDMMRAKMCAKLMNKHASKFKKNFLKCFKFMNKACKPGKDLKMDGDRKEYTTKKGYCRMFFPEDGNGLTPEDLDDHDGDGAKNMFDNVLESAKNKEKNLEDKARAAAKKLLGGGGDGDGDDSEGFGKNGFGSGSDADGDGDGEGGGEHHGKGHRSGDGDGDGNGNGDGNGGGDGDGHGHGHGHGDGDGDGDGSGDGNGGGDGDGDGDGDGHGHGHGHGDGHIGGPSKYGGTSQGHVNADDDGDYYSDGLEDTRASGKKWTKEEWAKLMKDGHDENTPMSEQGYGGARVAHNDGDTGITDWLHEFGKFRNKKSSREFHEICKKYPDNEWCLLHGFGQNSAAPRSTQLGFISGLLALMTVFTAGNLM